MKTNLLRILSILILATIVLMPGRGLGVGAARQAVQPVVPAAPTLGTTTRVSVASDGSQGNADGLFPSISADGRYVAFESFADNLVEGDTNWSPDIFVHNQQAGSTERVSVASDGGQGNGWSGFPSISADGRYVAFEYSSDDLVSGDTNGFRDVFVHDRQIRSTERVSLANDGSQGNDSSSNPSISADGRYVAFVSPANNLVSEDTNYGSDIFIHDWQTGSTERVSVASDGSQGNSGSYDPSISSDGRYVTFYSEANNLVEADTNGNLDIFVHDRQTGGTQRVSVASDGSQGNSASSFPFISADGRYVVFNSEANNLVSGDTNGVRDIFMHDRQTGTTQRVSVASDGSQGNSESYASSISSDGHYVGFLSLASNLVDGDTNNFCDTDYDGVYDDSCRDVFVHDRQTGLTELASVASDGSQGNNHSWVPSISANGRYIVFTSYATNLVTEDTNEVVDVFVRDRGVRSFNVYLPVTQNQP